MTTAEDKARLYNMYNATSTADPEGSDELETYENWLERQLLSRINNATRLPDDLEVGKWFDENIGNDKEKPCSASSAIYKFRLWLSEYLQKRIPNLTPEINKLAEDWADKLYDRDSNRTSTTDEMTDWENRKHNFIEGYKAALSEHSTKEQEELLSTLKEAEEQLRWLYNNAEFEGGMPVRSCIDKVNEVIKKYSTPVKK